MLCSVRAVFTEGRRPTLQETIKTIIIILVNNFTQRLRSLECQRPNLKLSHSVGDGSLI